MCKITVSADVFGCFFLSVEISGYSFNSCFAKTEQIIDVTGSVYILLMSLACTGQKHTTAPKLNTRVYYYLSQVKKKKFCLMSFKSIKSQKYSLYIIAKPIGYVSL